MLLPPPAARSVALTGHPRRLIGQRLRDLVFAPTPAQVEWFCERNANSQDGPVVTTTTESMPLIAKSGPLPHPGRLNPASTKPAAAHSAPHG